MGAAVAGAHGADRESSEFQLYARRTTPDVDDRTRWVAVAAAAAAAAAAVADPPRTPSLRRVQTYLLNLHAYRNVSSRM